MDEALANALDKVLILSGGDPTRGMFPPKALTPCELITLVPATEALNER